MPRDTTAATSARMLTDEHRHATRLEEERRVDRMMQLLARNRTPDAISHFMEEFGLGSAVAYDYEKKARTRITEEARAERQAVIAELINFYRNIITGPSVRTQDRLKAAEGFRKLLGLDAPVRAEIAGPGQSPIQLQAENTNLNVQAPADAHQLAEVLHILRQAGVFDTPDTTPPDPSPPERTA